MPSSRASVLVALLSLFTAGTLPAAAAAAAAAAGCDVAERVAYERGVGRRGAKALCLATPGCLHVEICVRILRQLVDKREQRLCVLHLEIVNSRLQTVARAERLGDDEMTGGERDADAVLEARIRVVVEVQLDVCAAQEAHQGLVVEAVADVHDRMRALDRSEQ